MNKARNLLQWLPQVFIAPALNILPPFILLAGSLVMNCSADQPGNSNVEIPDTGRQKAEELKELLSAISRPEVSREARKDQLIGFLERTGRLPSNTPAHVPEDLNAKRLKVLIMRFSADRAGVEPPSDFQKQKMDAFETEADFELV